MNSIVSHSSNDFAKKIYDLTNKGENVVILSNHQTEVDAQVISILLHDHGMEELAERIIFIAGHKVTTDPIAIPFSMGRNSSSAAITALTAVTDANG